MLASQPRPPRSPPRRANAQDSGHPSRCFVRQPTAASFGVTHSSHSSGDGAAGNHTLTLGAPAYPRKSATELTIDTPALFISSIALATSPVRSSTPRQASSIR